MASRTVHPVVPLLAATVLGVLLGLVARGGDRAALQTVHYLTALGGPWLVVAFAAGALSGAGSRRAGALRGAACVITGVVTYYLVMWRVEHLTGPQYAVPVAVAWSAGGAVVGACFGWLGAAWRADGSGRARWAAVLCGGLLGEALLLHELWVRPAAQYAVTAQAVGAVVLLAVLAPRPRTWPAVVPVLAVTATGFAVAAYILREGARVVGWAGA